MKPLADIVRPKKLEEVVGQKHILGKERLLRNIIESKHIPNMIFYGPPGTGKTTVANIIADSTNKRLYKLNATNASVQDIKNIISELDTFLAKDGILLYLDEIQNFNKKQQQSLLKFIENGQITLISSTTENPYFTIFNAIISRSTIFEFKKLEIEDIVEGLKRGIDLAEKEIINKTINYEEEALKYIATMSNGDLRRGLNDLESAIYYSINKIPICIDIDTAKESTQTSGFNYDKFGDNHYDTLSTFQKSIRGSDVDASIHYLARLIKAGDLTSICRRLLVIASEDIGLAYPNAITIIHSCVEAAIKLGLPEARIPLAQGVILLSNSPKSNSAINAIDKALKDIDLGNIGDIPIHLKDSHYKGSSKLGRGTEYKYPHSYPNHYVKQQYLPDNIKDKKYYEPANNKLELKFKEFQKSIRENKKS
ncbi:replication-associated recombination protein A [Clostridium sp. D2Q-11]|uniref:Replication-associated recombination protein A n=1 Tax=Anaeromonas frigoriresistens TaxID=2683708 RepID=A0A942UXR9_9FIRM|nr:replication-associated recombination protein A [Anaeromonas frigoriresistens]MBS4540060.1 replication-associated recombination protein A [Anaeromonas frigoriresistens]